MGASLPGAVRQRRIPVSQLVRRMEMNRREMLQSLSCGFGYLALAGMCAEGAARTAGATPLAPRAPHFPAKAKRVIFLYMQDAPSQHETFDYNPELAVATKSANV